jgi:mRNA interferase RelE/StbE
MGTDQTGKRPVRARPAYRIEFRPGARRQFKKLPKDIRKRITASIDALAADPRPRGSVKMSGIEDDTYRIRVGAYRIIYSIFDDILLVLVVKIGHRKEIYR